jgi:predicted transcriptional regulator
MLHGKTLHIEAEGSDEDVVGMLKALASLPRWRILQFLSDRAHSLIEVAEALSLPNSTAAAQLKILEDARFLHIEVQTGNRGLQKLYSRTYDNITLALPSMAEVPSGSVEVSMPIGAYTRFEVSPTCGLATENSLIGYLDDPISFYEPERMNAGLLWFRTGYVEYNFPNRLPESAKPRNMLVSMEICAEAPLHNNDWPSDITLWVNEHEVGTWTCPGDFGGERGRLTPTWWDSKDSQYGVLKRWLISEEGSFIDGFRLSSVTVKDLGLDVRRVITVRLGVKGDALHVGGLNLFGRTFGNYPQDLTLRTEYTPGRRADDNGGSESVLSSPNHEEVTRLSNTHEQEKGRYSPTNSQRRKQGNVQKV